jgi:hypothetical protein
MGSGTPKPRSSTKIIVIAVLVAVVAVVAGVAAYYALVPPASPTFQIAGMSVSSTDLSVTGQPLLSANATCPSIVKADQTFTCTVMVFSKQNPYVEIHQVAQISIFTYVGVFPTLPYSIPYGQTDSLQVQLQAPNTSTGGSAGTVYLTLYD